MNPRVLIVVLLTAVWAPLALAQTVMSNTQFRDHVIAEAKSLNNAYQIEVTGSLSFKIDDGFVNLDSGYAEYLNDQSQLENITRRWVQMFSMIAEGADVSESDIAQRLVMLVRSNAYTNGIPNDLEPAKTPVWRPLAGDVVVMMMVDYPTMRGSVTTDLLVRAGLNQDEAWRLAKDNSIAAMGHLGVGAYGPGGPVAITAESGLATAILADPGVCSEAGMFVGAYVLVVDRDTFLIARSEDAASLQNFWNFVRYAAESGTFASRTPLTCEAGKLVEAIVPN